MAEISMNEEQEKKLASWVNSKFKEAMTAKEEITTEWMDYMNAWNNSLYTSQSGPDYKSNHVSNLIYSTIESMRPIMFDGDPKFEAIPVTKDAVRYCNDVNTIMSYEWHRTGMKQKCIANSIYTLCIGTSVFMLPYSFDGDNPEGDVEPVAVNPFNLYPDPLATCVEDAEYIMYATYVHENILKQRYTDRVEDIEGGDIQYSELAPNKSENAKIDNQVLLIECWCRDYTSMEDVEDEEGNKAQTLKYPLGRVIIAAPELGIIFEDKENPYETGRFPFFLFKDIDVPFRFWGEGEIKWLLSPQKAINDLSNQIIDNAKHTANMQWIVDKTAGIPKGQLNNRPGLIIRKNPGSEVRRDSPPSMPMYVSEMISRLENNIEVISGVHDVTRGRNPGGIESGTAILALQDAAQTRIRLKISLHEEALSKLGTEWLARIKQFWTVNRLIPKQVADAQKLPEYGMVGIEMMQMPPYNNVQDADPYDFIEVSKDEQLNEQYRIMVQGSSGYRLNRTSMLDTMLQLIRTPAEDGMPVVPREAVLDYLPDVNKQIVLDYFAKLKQEQLQQQQSEMMNNEALQQMQMMQDGLGQVGSELGSLKQRAQQEDDAKARDEVMAQGYQQGLNESQAMNQMLNTSGQIPEELMQEMAGMSDVELAQLLQEHPELANMI